MYWIHTITPLHVGAGRGIGFIDLPIAREKITNWPLVPGSAVKGVWKSHFEGRSGSAPFVAAFGRATGERDEDRAGSLVLTDARIVLLPIRSFFGTFAYATSPMALRRLSGDLAASGVAGRPAIPTLPEGAAQIGAGSALTSNGRVFFEDLDFAATETAEATGWADFLAKELFHGDAASASLFKARFVVLSDDSFNFLCESATEVNARIRIEDDKKIVARGALWYEESLPCETVLAGLAWCDQVYGVPGVTPAEVLEAVCGQPINCQIGGKASVGKGRVRCVFTGKEA
jgi:CRISPR-associated protein Cmr4